MSKVTFNTEQVSQTSRTRRTKSAGLTGWLISKGIAKDRATANKYLLAVLVIGLIIIIWLNWPASASTPRMTPEQMQFEAELYQG